MKITKSIKIGLVVFAVIVVGALIGLMVTRHNQPPAASQIAPLQVNKTEVSTEKLPEKFPTDIPLESGANIINNYNATTPDGRFQATRTFQTSKSLSDNLAIYSKYLTDHKWVVKTVSGSESAKMVSGSKDNQRLQITLSENSESHIKTVAISYTELP